MKTISLLALIAPASAAGCLCRDGKTSDPSCCASPSGQCNTCKCPESLESGSCRSSGSHPAYLGFVLCPGCFCDKTAKDASTGLPYGFISAGTSSCHGPACCTASGIKAGAVTSTVAAPAAPAAPTKATASAAATPTERCDPNNCMKWSCLDWCECYDESKVDVYNSFDGCKDDNDDTCVCFNKEEHELNGERHRKINYNQDAVDAAEARFIEGTNIHMATKQNHYQEAGAKAGKADQGNTKKPVASSNGGVASTSYRHGLNAHGGYYQHCAALDKPIIDTQCQGLTEAGKKKKKGSYDTSAKCEKFCCEDEDCETWEFHAEHGCWVSHYACKHSGVTKRSDGAWVGKSPGWHGYSSMYGITL